MGCLRCSGISSSTKLASTSSVPTCIYWITSSMRRYRTERCFQLGMFEKCRILYQMVYVDEIERTLGVIYERVDVLIMLTEFTLDECLQ